jgi:SAM-dependent methyltransferase
VLQSRSSTLDATQLRSSPDPRTVALFPGGELLLDLGCGDGAFLDLVATRYRRAIGFDVSTRRFSTRRREPEAWEFVIADLNEGIPAETGAADAVHANQVIEHVDNPLFLAREVHRVLRPGGMFVAATPNVRYLKHVARLLLAGRGPMTSASQARMSGDWDGGHIHYLTPKDLRWITREAGFRRCSVRALVAPSGDLRALRPLLARYATSWPVRELLSGNSQLIAYA